MKQIIPLDSGPLGLLCCDSSIPLARRCFAWLRGRVVAGASVVIPSVIDYEVRRELIRISATAKLARLDRLVGRLGREEVTIEAFEKAAEFWADLRRRGRPTAGPDSLDSDAILAGLAATIGGPGDSMIVATSNVRHLARFPGIDARDWETIA